MRWGLTAYVLSCQTEEIFYLSARPRKIFRTAATRRHGGGPSGRSSSDAFRRRPGGARPPTVDGNRFVQHRRGARGTGNADPASAGRDVRVVDLLVRAGQRRGGRRRWLDRRRALRRRAVRRRHTARRPERRPGRRSRGTPGRPARATGRPAGPGAGPPAGSGSGTGTGPRAPDTVALAVAESLPGTAAAVAEPGHLRG